MRKTAIIFLLLLLVTGCGRKELKGAAAHVGRPREVQIVAERHPSVSVRGKENIQKFMDILEKIDVRKLSVEEEIDLVLVQGKTLDATEMRFKDHNGKTYKALLLSDGSLLVVEGARGENQKRRDIYLSEPNQEALVREVQKAIESGLSRK